ncbi:hypothetical protein E8E13_001971 [Curvularia kusanoi]|uniref:Uncharacterized protein n=1 Tax=Curvularia kusanoi TaxID=90978 RepID=A0A9P4TA01_CURKU|nr:hypothetical protein E8E13_001971 [Curvularia kusanoi]
MEHLVRDYGHTRAAAIKSAWAELSAAEKELIQLQLNLVRYTREYLDYKRKFNRLRMRFGKLKTLDSTRKAVYLIIGTRVRDKQLKGQVFDHRQREQVRRLLALQTQFERVWVPAILCDKIYNIFSREVRDMIYGELHAEHHSRPIDDLYLTLKQRQGFPLTEHALSGRGHSALERAYFDERIVGATIAREIVEAWYKRASFARETIISMPFHYYMRVDRWGLGLRPAHLLRHVTLKFREDAVREFRSSLSRFSGLRQLRGIRGLRDLYIIIESSMELDVTCLGCGLEKTYCKGNFDNFLSRDERDLWKVDKRFVGIGSALPQLERAGLRLLVSYEHDIQKYPAITLHKPDDALSPEKWVEILEEFREGLMDQAKKICYDPFVGPRSSESSASLEPDLPFFGRSSDIYTDTSEHGIDTYDSSDFTDATDESDSESDSEAESPENPLSLVIGQGYGLSLD